jgi:hypothetical protein
MLNRIRTGDPEILENLRMINIRLNNIEKRIENIENSSNKVCEHVDFVDTVFESCKKPFNSILTYYSGKQVNIDKNKIDYTTNSKQIENSAIEEV